jgi:hypothetical protein
MNDQFENHKGHGQSGNFFYNLSELSSAIILNYPEQEAEKAMNILENAGVKAVGIGNQLLVPSGDKNVRGIISGVGTNNDSPQIVLTILNENNYPEDLIIDYQGELKTKIEKLMGWR